MNNESEYQLGVTSTIARFTLNTCTWIYGFEPMQIGPTNEYATNGGII